MSILRPATLERISKLLSAISWPDGPESVDDGLEILDQIISALSVLPLTALASIDRGDQLIDLPPAQADELLALIKETGLDAIVDHMRIRSASVRLSVHSIKWIKRCYADYWVGKYQGSESDGRDNGKRSLPGAAPRADQSGTKPVKITRYAHPEASDAPIDSSASTACPAVDLKPTAEPSEVVDRPDVLGAHSINIRRTERTRNIHPHPYPQLSG